MNTHINTTKKNIIGALFLCLPFLALAQETEAATKSYFSNALFNTLLVTIIMLAILVLALSSVLKNLSSSDALMNLIKQKEDKDAKSTPNATTLLFFLLLAGSSLYGQNAVTAAVNDGRVGGIDAFTFYTMMTTIFLELIVVAVLINTLKYLLKTKDVKQPSVVVKPKEKTLLDKLSGAVDVEQEETIMLDHNYDGIRELDNDLPPWWKYGFYLTILVAVVYLINYHVAKTSPLQQEEYTMSLKKADAEIAEFMKTSANNVDESTVKMLDNPTDLATAKDLFISTCAACHGKFGEGTVGPNLTDDYWIHSGSIREIFKTIKYGWPDKGMKSWKEDFSPIQIAQLTSYIRTLRGTNPPKPKDKQGDLYIEEIIQSDSTALKSDSLKIVSVADTLKNK